MTSTHYSRFTSWRTLNRNGNPSTEAPFTLKMDNYYSWYNSPSQPKALFNSAATIITELRNTIPTKKASIYTEFTANEISHVIFGSNMIEKAGLGLEDTIKICLEIFNGIEVSSSIDEQSEEYQLQLQTLIGLERTADLDSVIRGRMEIIQHAKAFKYLIDQFVYSDIELSEQLILDTHKILCKDIPSANGNLHYIGKYRTTLVSAGLTIFTPPEHVPEEIQKFIQDFNKDIREREESLEMDPFFLAADICQDFVNIHPFLDGNGRMCRLLANAYLMRYAGVVVAIGENERDRDEYIRIAEFSGDGETEEAARGTLAGFFLEKGEGTLRRLEERLRLN